MATNFVVAWCMFQKLFQTPNEYTSMLFSYCFETWEPQVRMMNITDFVDSIPLYALVNFGPSIVMMRTRTDIERFILKMYAMLRFVTKTYETGLHSLIREETWQYNSNKPAGIEKIELALKGGMMRMNVSGKHNVYYMPASTPNLKRAELQLIAHSNRSYNYWSGGGTIRDYILRGNHYFVDKKDQVVPDLVREGNDFTVISYEPRMDRGEIRELYFKEAIAPKKMWMGEWTWDYETNCIPEQLILTQCIGGQPSFGGDMLIEPIHSLVNTQYRQVGQMVLDKAQYRLEAFRSAVAEGVDHFTAFKRFYRGDIDMLGYDIANIAKGAELNGDQKLQSYYEQVKDEFDKLVQKAVNLYRDKGKEAFSKWFDELFGDEN
jgi:hypothetical protein